MPFPDFAGDSQHFSASSPGKEFTDLDKPKATDDDNEEDCEGGKKKTEAEKPPQKRLHHSVASAQAQLEMKPLWTNFTNWAPK